MSSLQKKILLYDLIHNRRYVTLETIKSECQVSERTAYRYINKLLEANIPIQYDKKIGAYCLSKEFKRNDNFNLDDSILILFGLRYLSKLVGSSYKKKIDALIKNFIIKQEYPLEELLESYNEYFENIDRSKKSSNLISSLIILSAIRFKKKINILLDNNSPHQIAKLIEKPAIFFKDNWSIKDMGQDDAGSNLEDILMVSVDKN